MKPIYIIKLGGSIVTYKNRPDGQLRKSLVGNIARNIRQAIKGKDFDLILIHGAGSKGHQLAHKYSLAKGANQVKRGWEGSFSSRIANQKLDLGISEIFLKNKLPVVSIHTSSIIIQKNQKIINFNLDTIKEALSNKCIPLLYGEMVFDKALGMTICSGDSIAPYLAKKLKAKKLFFASDIDGIFSKDPHLHKNIGLIGKLSLANIHSKSAITNSHNIDTTRGLLGKIEKMETLKDSETKTVEIFNGLVPENYSKILSGKKFKHTIIKI